MFQNYVQPVDHEASLVTYLKDDNNLFAKLTDNKMKIQQYFNNMNGSFENSIGNMKTAGFNKLEYISDDQFKPISEVTITQNKSADNEKTKTIEHCTRIK